MNWVLTIHNFQPMFSKTETITLAVLSRQAFLVLPCKQLNIVRHNLLSDPLWALMYPNAWYDQDYFTT